MTDMLDDPATMTPSQRRREIAAILARGVFRRCAWRVQALAEGDLPDRVRRRALEIANDADTRVIPPRNTIPSTDGPTRTEPTSFERDERLPAPGTTLERVFKGVVHYVVVLPNGFEYKGRFYRSLSAVATEISGNHWNGYKFFHKALEFAGKATASGCRRPSEGPPASAPAGMRSRLGCSFS